MSIGQEIAEKDFSKAVVKALGRKGITLIGITALPDASGSFLNSDRGYTLNDNGTHRIRTYREVVSISVGSPNQRGLGPVSEAA